MWGICHDSWRHLFEDCDQGSFYSIHHMCIVCWWGHTIFFFGYSSSAVSRTLDRSIFAWTSLTALSVTYNVDCRQTMWYSNLFWRNACFVCQNVNVVCYHTQRTSHSNISSPPPLLWDRVLKRYCASSEKEAMVLLRVLSTGYKTTSSTSHNSFHVQIR